MNSFCYIYNSVMVKLSDMRKFEYKSYVFAYMEQDSLVESDIKELNKLGADGWEVVAVSPVKLWKQVGRPENLVAILKREVDNNKKR